MPVPIRFADLSSKENRIRIGKVFSGDCQGSGCFSAEDKKFKIGIAPGDLIRCDLAFRQSYFRKDLKISRLHTGTEKISLIPVEIHFKLYTISAHIVPAFIMAERYSIDGFFSSQKRKI